MVEGENAECAKPKDLSGIGICPTLSQWLPLGLGTLFCLLIELNLFVFQIGKLRPKEGQRSCQSPMELTRPGSLPGNFPPTPKCSVPGGQEPTQTAGERSLPISLGK